MPSEIATIPSPAPMGFDAMKQLAESIAKSRLFGITTADQALALMSIAQAEGRHPALAARDYHIINGNPSKKAEAMLRDFLGAGGRVEWHELSDTAAEATFSHPAGGSMKLRWDQARVLQAGLGGGNHKKYPRQMLRSRVVSEGVRTVWPMATGGLYVPEEVADFAPAQGQPIDVTPKADLDQFAGASADGVTNGDALRYAAERTATDGTDAFRSWWKTLDAAQRDYLRPDIATFQQVATDADAKATGDRDEDPFGLSPINAARGNYAPERSPAGEDAQHDGASPGGPAPAGEPPTTDLPGDTPAENLFVPLAHHPTAADLDYYGRQMLDMIAEKPGDFQRIAKIKAINDRGIHALKAAGSDRCNDVMRALKGNG